MVIDSRTDITVSVLELLRYKVFLTLTKNLNVLFTLFSA